MKSSTEIVDKIVQGFTDNINRATFSEKQGLITWDFSANGQTYEVSIGMQDSVVAIVANNLCIKGYLEDESLNIIQGDTKVGVLALNQRNTAKVTDLLTQLERRRVHLQEVQPLQTFLDEMHKGHMLAEDYIERR